MNPGKTLRAVCGSDECWPLSLLTTSAGHLARCFLLSFQSPRPLPTRRQGSAETDCFPRGLAQPLPPHLRALPTQGPQALSSINMPS